MDGLKRRVPNWYLFVMSNSQNSSIVFSTLSEVEARVVLSRNSLGRLAYSRHNRVDIEPLYYVLNADWMYGRTSAGSKIATLAHQHWCAFEVDEVRSMFDWTSVVVQGSFHVLNPAGDVTAYEHGLALLRAFYAGTLMDDDYAPHRTTLFRISIGSISGRSAQPMVRDP